MSRKPIRVLPWLAATWCTWSIAGVAPWLRAPRTLDEARGFKRPRPQPQRQVVGPQFGPIAPEPNETVQSTGKKERPVEFPAMYESLNARLKKIVPYPDVIRQVEENYHGKGGLKRSYHEAKKTVKAKEPSVLDRRAATLHSSRTTMFAKAPLLHSSKWPTPDPKYPEVAFIGRSNVGKSSLLNRICSFGSVARVSCRPGETKQAVWYRNRKVGIDFIDMPGYGHSDRAKIFGPEALEFVKNRTSLKVLYVLVDSRHGFKWSDHEWLNDLGYAGPMKQVILTKCDKVPEKRLIKIASLARSDLEQYKRVDRKILLSSAAWQSGFHELRKDICQRCGRTQLSRKEMEQMVGEKQDLPMRAVKGQDLGILQ